jgi:hypothetical protein
VKAVQEVEDERDGDDRDDGDKDRVDGGLATGS